MKFNTEQKEEILTLYSQGMNCYDLKLLIFLKWDTEITAESLRKLLRSEGAKVRSGGVLNKMSAARRRRSSGYYLWLKSVFNGVPGGTAWTHDASIYSLKKRKGVTNA